jgi:hypothetical protein
MYQKATVNSKSAVPTAPRASARGAMRARLQQRSVAGFASTDISSSSFSVREIMILMLTVGTLWFRSLNERRFV